MDGSDLLRMSTIRLGRIDSDRHRIAMLARLGAPARRGRINPSTFSAALSSSTAADAELASHDAASPFMKTMLKRGYLYQCTNIQELDKLMTTSKIVAYIGFDAAVPSLHVGSLVQIMILRHLQKAGHKPIVLLGGGTTKVGDPSGRDTTRQMLGDDKLQENMDSIFFK